MSQVVDGYRTLIRAFVEHAMDAPEFSERFLQAFKRERATLPTQEFLILDQLFGDADSYTQDEYLLAASPEFHLTGDALRARAAAALALLAHPEG